MAYHFHPLFLFGDLMTNDTPDHNTDPGIDQRFPRVATKPQRTAPRDNPLVLDMFDDEDAITLIGEVTGQPERNMRTYISLDLAVSIATGTRFLNKWWCPSKRVLFCCTNPDRDINPKRNAMIASRIGRLQFDHHDTGFGEGWMDNLAISDRTPNLRDLPALEKLIRGRGIQVLFIDDLLQATGLHDAHCDPSEMLSVLDNANRVCIKAGCNLIIVEYPYDRESAELWSRGGIRRPAEIDEISDAGLMHACNQHLVISPQRPITHPTNTSKLWLNFGLSCDRPGGTFAATITEGREFDKWKVTIAPSSS